MDCLGGSCEIVVFSDCFQSYSNLIEVGEVVFIKGKSSENSDFSNLKIIADEIIHINQARRILSRSLNIRFPSGEVHSNDVDELMQVSKSNPGDCRLLFHLPNPGSNKSLKILAHNIRVSTDITFIKTLRGKYGKDNVWIE